MKKLNQIWNYIREQDMPQWYLLRGLLVIIGFIIMMFSIISAGSLLLFILAFIWPVLKWILIIFFTLFVLFFAGMLSEK
jgi:hypothetical protein